VGVSLVGVVLEWRLAARGLDPAAIGSASGAALDAFHETFLALAATMAVAVLAAWRMRPRDVASA
jgi:hypothetical protein